MGEYRHHDRATARHRRLRLWCTVCFFHALHEISMQFVVFDGTSSASLPFSCPLHLFAFSCLTFSSTYVFELIFTYILFTFSFYFLGAWRNHTGRAFLLAVARDTWPSESGHPSESFARALRGLHSAFFFH